MLSCCFFCFVFLFFPPADAEGGELRPTHLCAGTEGARALLLLSLAPGASLLRCAGTPFAHSPGGCLDVMQLAQKIKKNQHFSPLAELRGHPYAAGLAFGVLASSQGRRWQGCSSYRQCISPRDRCFWSPGCSGWHRGQARSLLSPPRLVGNVGAGIQRAQVTPGSCAPRHHSKIYKYLRDQQLAKGRD